MIPKSRKSTGSAEEMLRIPEVSLGVLVSVSRRLSCGVSAFRQPSAPRYRTIPRVRYLGALQRIPSLATSSLDAAHMDRPLRWQWRELLASHKRSPSSPPIVTSTDERESGGRRSAIISYPSCISWVFQRLLAQKLQPQRRRCWMPGT